MDYILKFKKDSKFVIFDSFNKRYYKNNSLNCDECILTDDIESCFHFNSYQCARAICNMLNSNSHLVFNVLEV